MTRQRPFSDAGIPSRKPAFVGREQTLAAVVEAIHESRSVLIEGEPGIGKTRLVREVLQRATGRRFLLASPPPFLDPFPLGAVVVGLRRLWERVGPVDLSPLGGALRPLFPEWADGLPSAPAPFDSPRETRHRLLCALTELIERLGVDVIVVDDAHWADSATMEWLLMLAAAEEPRAIVMAYRPSDIDVESLLARFIARVPIDSHRLRIELAPLSVEQTRSLVASMLHTDEVSMEFAAFLHEHVDGLPLAIEETVRLLRDRHDIVRHNGSWVRRILENLDVPPVVRDSVLERVGRLAPEARRVLSAATILGEPADEESLVAVAGLDGDRGQKGVIGALASGLLREAGPGLFVFRHVLDAQAIEGSIPAPERRRLHHRAAVELRHQSSAPARLTRHFREAGEVQAWAREAEAAAEVALESGDEETAVITLLEPLEAADLPLGMRLQLLQRAGQAAFFGATESDALRERVVALIRRSLEEPELTRNMRGKLRLDLGRLLWALGQPVISAEEMETAIPDLGASPDLAMRAMLNLSLPLVPEWPTDRHRQWLDRAVRLYRSNGCPADEVVFAGARAATLLALGDAAGWDAVDEIPATAGGVGERRLLVAKLIDVVHAMLPWGRYGDARLQLNRANDLLQTANHKALEVDAQLAEASLRWYTGEWGRLGPLQDGRSTQVLETLRWGCRRGDCWRCSGLLPDQRANQRGCCPRSLQSTRTRVRWMLMRLQCRLA